MSASSLIAASIQMVSAPDVPTNLTHAARLVANAASQGAQLVVLPEYFALMGLNDTDKVAVREAWGHGPIQDALAAMARRHQIWLVGGTLPLAAPDANKVYNSCLLFAPDGSVAARYDKIHLFGFSGLGERYCEADTITPGQQPVAVDTPLGRIGLSVCYDLRFPELFRAMDEPDIIVLPAAFTAITGQAHWEPLLRARAIENQCFVIASGQGGTHASGRTTHGHSMLIDPWGVILAEQAHGEGMALAELDLRQMASVRTRLPALAHRIF